MQSNRLEQSSLFFWYLFVLHSVRVGVVYLKCVTSVVMLDLPVPQTAGIQHLKTFIRFEKDIWITWFAKNERLVTTKINTMNRFLQLLTTIC